MLVTSYFSIACLLQHVNVWLLTKVHATCSAGDLGSLPGLGRFPGEGNGNPLQYSSLGNPMDRGARQAPDPEVAEESNMMQPNDDSVLYSDFVSFCLMSFFFSGAPSKIPHFIKMSSLLRLLWSDTFSDFSYCFLFVLLKHSWFAILC